MNAVIFDLNGIFLQSPKLSERIEKDFGVDSSIFLPVLFEIMQELRKPGAKKAFSVWEPYLKNWNINMTEGEFWKYWFSVEIPSERIIKFAKGLREKGIKVFILSNNFKERAEFYDHYPWIHYAVDKSYFSWQTGFVKPDVRAWEFVLSENNLKAEECLYFDDQEKNVKVAKSIGIFSFLFENEQKVEEIVNQYL